jgi:hypothetical protein
MGRQLGPGLGGPIRLYHNGLVGSFESSRAHHAFFLTARFPGDGQEARNWRAFADAFRSPRTPFPV